MRMASSKASVQPPPSLSHLLLETIAHNLSPALPPPRSPPHPTAAPPSHAALPPKTMSTRDKYAQEMHINTATVTAVTTERKYLRLLRNEMKRNSGAVRIQAAVRGYLQRSELKRQIGLFKQRKVLEHQELEWLRYDRSVLEKLCGLLRVSLERLKREGEERGEEQRRGEELRRKLEERVQELLAIHEQREAEAAAAAEEEGQGERSDDDNVGEVAALTMEQMRGELLSLQETQLLKQREEFESLLKGLGKEMTTALLSALPHTLPPPTAAPSAEGEEAQEGQEGDDCEEALVVKEPPLPDIEHIKNLYLPLWGNDSFPVVEIVSLVASSTVEYSLLEASIDTSPEGYPVALYPLHDNESFKNIHWTIFTRDAAGDLLLPSSAGPGATLGLAPALTPPTPAGAPPNSFYLMKIRLNSSSGKTCKLKFPATKISEICANRRSVNVTLNDFTKFEISGTSLRVDELADCFLKLWDSHVAWVTQKIITSATLCENLQCFLKMIFEQSSAAAFTASAPSLLLEGGSQMVRTSKARGRPGGGGEGYPIGWLTQRYDLLSCLWNAVKETRSAKRQYDQTVERCVEELALLLKRWGYYPGSTSHHDATHRSPGREDPSSLPWRVLSRKLSSLVENIFDPFQNYLSYTSSPPSQTQQQMQQQTQSPTPTPALDAVPSSSILHQGHVNYHPFHESLLSRHESHHSKIYPILKAIFLEFIRNLNIEPIFNQLLIEPLMQLCHDRWVTAFAHCESYPWELWCQGNQEWVQFMEVPSPPPLPSTAPPLTLSVGISGFHERSFQSQSHDPQVLRDAPQRRGIFL
jgi:hypothetical protein